MPQASFKRHGISSSPLEVRRMIWVLLLVPNEHVNVTYSTSLSPFPDSQGKLQAKAIKSPIPVPAILRVSKRIHEEAEEVLYSSNTFEFNEISAIDDLILFLQSMSDRAYLSLIRKIVIKLPYSIARELESPIDFLVGCQGLKSLTLTNMPLQHGKIPRCIQTWMSGLRLDTINFLDVSPENSSDLSQIIRGNRKNRTKSQEKRACEEGRASKVTRWGEFEFKKCDVEILYPRLSRITAGKIVFD